MGDILAKRVADIDDHKDTPGVFELREFEYAVSGIAFICPCGCGREGYLPLEKDAGSPRWDWDGNRDAPTLTPSVLFRGGCQWHGWLRAGMWVSC